MLSTAFSGIMGAEIGYRMTVRDVITTISRYSVGDREFSVNDRLIAGSYDTEVAGIVVTFMATVDVIRKAVELGANLIIIHEPTFYTGGDATDWLKNDPVYLEKKKLIEPHGMAIWRYHDSMHMVQPDGIYAGLWKEIDWEKYLVSKDNPWICEIPETTLADLARLFREKLCGCCAHRRGSRHESPKSRHSRRGRQSRPWKGRNIRAS
uniref:NGG1p interacting factor NIF3 n=1 Tax=Candidatus Caldatribacterium californiense TaxID=1454726 RepID=A0A7V3YMQ3_9BACT